VAHREAAASAGGMSAGNVVGRAAAMMTGRTLGRLRYSLLLAVALAGGACAHQKAQRPEAVQYWLWILSVGEAHSKDPYPSLEGCRRPKEFWMPPPEKRMFGVQVPRCLTVWRRALEGEFLGHRPGALHPRGLGMGADGLEGGA